MQITFTASTLADLESQIRAFLGDAAPVQGAATPTASAPVPAWAPHGSHWIPTPGAPVLLGPDGKVIPVRWEGRTPYLGEVTYNHDPAAEAAGAALLESLRPR